MNKLHQHPTLLTMSNSRQPLKIICSTRNPESDSHTLRRPVKTPREIIKTFSCKISPPQPFLYINNGGDSFTLV